MRKYRPELEVIHPPRCVSPRDLSSKEGAELHARQIEEFWHSRGYPQVEAWVTGSLGEPVGCKHTGAVFIVATNLVNGMPPRKKESKNGQFRRNR